MSHNQLEPEDTLDYTGVDDVLDEGYSPPDREPYTMRHIDDSLDERLRDEEPEVWADLDEETDEDYDDQVGDARSGRLTMTDGSDVFARDVGIDGAGASAEEAAMHTIADEDE